MVFILPRVLIVSVELLSKAVPMSEVYHPRRPSHIFTQSCRRCSYWVLNCCHEFRALLVHCWFVSSTLVYQRCLRLRVLITDILTLRAASLPLVVPPLFSFVDRFCLFTFGTLVDLVPNDNMARPERDSWRMSRKFATIKSMK